MIYTEICLTQYYFAFVYVADLLNLLQRGEGPTARAGAAGARADVLASRRQGQRMRRHDEGAAGRRAALHSARQGEYIFRTCAFREHAHRLGYRASAGWMCAIGPIYSCDICYRKVGVKFH